MAFDDKHQFANHIELIGKEKGIRYKSKLMDSSNQYYMYCIHRGDKETKISSKCKAQVYGRFRESNGKSKLVVVDIITQHTGHFRYTDGEIRKMIKSKDIPDNIKDSAVELFLNGWNVSEILPSLLIKYPDSKYYFSLYFFDS